MKDTNVNWEPIITIGNKLYDDIVHIIKKVGDNFFTLSPNEMSDLFPHAPSQKSLFQGIGGYIVLAKELSVSGFLDDENKYSFLFDLIYNDPRKCTYNLCDGLVGQFFLQKSYNPYYIHDSEPELFQKIKPIAMNELQSGNLDFFHGPIGFIYFLLRYYPDSFMLDEWIETLLKLKQDPTWVFYNYETRSTASSFTPVSIPHGILSILIILSDYHKLHPNKALKELILDQVAYLNAHKNSSDALSIFPVTISGDPETNSSTLGWCFGDMMVGYTYISVGNSLGVTSLYQEGIDIILESTKRKECEVNGLFDSCLCHGYAGNAFLYAYFYNLTNTPQFKSQAIFWAEKSLTSYAEMQVFETRFMQNNTFFFKEDHSLLYGNPGILLSLLALISNTSPKWKHFLLLPD